MGSAPSNEANREIHLPPTPSAPISQGTLSIKVSNIISTKSKMSDSDTTSLSLSEHSNGDNSSMADEDEAGKSIVTYMSEDELNEFTTKTHMMLRTSALEAMAIKQKLNDDGLYVEKIKATLELFYEACTMLKLASLEHIIKFQQEVANILLQTKFINILCECVMSMHIRGLVSSDGIVDMPGYTITKLALIIALNYSDESDDVVTSLINYEKYLETIKKMLEERTERHLKNDKSKLSQYDLELIATLLGVAHNIAMRSNIHRLRSLNFTDVIKPYLTSWDETCSLLALAVLAAIINEAECDIINAAHDKVQYLLKVLENGLNSKQRRSSDGWSCKECAYIVRMLAQNDANKQLLVQIGALELLVKMGLTGNDEEERCESVSALWALCFDKTNQQKVAKNENLGLVELLFELKTSEDARIRKACNGALWTLRDVLASSEIQKFRIFALRLDADISQKVEREENKGAETKETDAPRGHIMISYQWDNQQLLKAIRDKLKENKFKVWMDIDEMGGSTVQAMASAVENAELVLMCVSQKYKNSPNCRAEAEYAFQKKKNIIPLKMDRGYDPDGWLGFICGAKLFYDFSGKYSFDDKLNALIRELAKHWTSKGLQSELSIQPEVVTKIHTQPVVAFDHADSASAPSSSNRVLVSMEIIGSVRKWTDSALKTWIDTNGLKSVLPSNINRDDIALLLKMMTESPDFFYRCTNDMLKIRNLSSLSKLVWALQSITTN
ncbi:uncharacterized protein LOC127871977 [Dreissena polymorpha]|uniref:TIR domain-containing protein n=1 Tax=Dreissena polymorpha TaxID=45954 RepID=A0A9D4LLH9_DREPO|nr:uncharacterized protein LOC127871977 [Dreissena polymorpha]KAH3859833.1 hypothetical protein DPMN_102654 [Dreissena polymorpha]